MQYPACPQPRCRPRDHRSLGPHTGGDAGCLSTHPPTHPCIHPSTHPYIHPSTPDLHTAAGCSALGVASHSADPHTGGDTGCLSTHPPLHHPPLHASTHLSTHNLHTGDGGQALGVASHSPGPHTGGDAGCLSIHPPIHPCIHPSIHPSTPDLHTAAGCSTLRAHSHGAGPVITAVQVLTQVETPAVLAGVAQGAGPRHTARVTARLGDCNTRGTGYWLPECVCVCG